MHGDMADNIKRLETEYMGRLEVIFSGAASRGELKDSVDIPDAVKAFWACYSYCILEGLKSPAFDVEGQLALLGRLIDQLLDGIGAHRTEKVLPS